MFDYDSDNDGELLSEKEIIRVLAIHYMLYKNMPWFIRLYYKPWIALLDSLVQYLTPTFVAKMTESENALGEVENILKESYNEDSNS